jgi:transposase InsO family protein
MPAAKSPSRARQWPTASSSTIRQYDVSTDLELRRSTASLIAMEWFRNRVDAKITIESWLRQFNEVRPHSSLGNLTPAEWKQKLLQPNLTMAEP